MIENSIVNLGNLLHEYEFPHVDTQLKETQYCLSACKHLIDAKNPKVIEHVKTVLDRHDMFFLGKKELLIARTPSKLVKPHDIIPNIHAANAYHDADWKKLINELGIQLRLPCDVVCLEHLYHANFPIRNQDGELKLVLKGCVVFAKQVVYDGIDSILLDIINLCSKPYSPDVVKPCNMGANFMLTTNKQGQPIALTKDKDEKEWNLFKENTAENLPILQLVILLIMTQISHDVFWDVKKYAIK